MIMVFLSRLFGERRWTQADLSRAIGIRPSTVSDMYNEISERVSLEHLDLIFEALFRRNNHDERPAGYDGHSMNVSDIVTLWGYSVDPPFKTVWYCDSLGFNMLDGTTGERMAD